MVFVRTKRLGNKDYYYLVENKREGNKVQQRVIKYLGSKKPTNKEIEAILRQLGGDK